MQSKWKHLLQELEKTFYLEPVLIIVSFFLLFIILRHLKKEKLSYLFLIYTISCIILFVANNIKRSYFPTSARTGMIFSESSNALFAISELCVFIIFFFKIIESKTFKKLLVLFMCVFFISIAMFFAKALNTSIGKEEIMEYSITANILEFCILLIAILGYFVELFKKPPTDDLTDSPAFWISSGLFIYILTSLPVLLFSEFAWAGNKNLYFLLFSLHFLSLNLLLLTIAKAFLCRQPITT